MRLRGRCLTPSGARAWHPTSPWRVVTALGIAQILAWGSSYYLPAVLAQPIAADTGWPLTWIVGGLSLGLLVAGLASPMVGRRIRHHGGRPVLGISALLLSSGLLGLALAPNLPFFVAAWVVMGLGMGTGLYDPAFSTLGHLYGSGARQHITTLTLFGGFASTACWPLSAFLVSELGWRGACLSYAAIHLFISLPLYLKGLPRSEAICDDESAVPVAATGVAPSGSLFLLLAATLMIGAVLSTIMSVHLLSILQARDITLAGAVALGALVGPSQVGARFIEMLVGRYHHPIWTKIASVSFVALGLGLLWLEIPVVALAMMFYGAGIGLESIARATLPLTLFGPADYAPIMGRLARPSLIAQAAAPSLGALLIARLGVENGLGCIVLLAAANVMLVMVLYARCRSLKRAG